MATNFKGVFPIDPTTQVGLFRTELGDIVATELEPPEQGYAAYQYISDAAIAALLLANPTDFDRAKSSAMIAVATQMLMSAQDIQVDDIRIKTVERATAMMNAALALHGSAGIAAAADAFDVVPLTSQSSFHRARPQGTPHPIGESGF